MRLPLASLSALMLLAQAGMACTPGFELRGWPEGKPMHYGELGLADFEGGVVVAHGAQVSAADAALDYNGNPSITLAFSDAGRRAIADHTAANIGAPMAVIVDGTLITAPRIMSPIDDGVALIQPFEDMAEATSAAETIMRDNCPPTTG